ncbi:MAG: hypothetical protein GEV11_23635 [Streptosporangiales bacterium]|nr:hypothetical protein [Streptosporangiales bacterium]
MTALGALIAVTVPGAFGAGTVGEATAREQREAGETPPVKVDLAWVPKAKRTLRSVDENLSRIGSAEKAYASVAEERRTPEIRGWMAELAVKKAELTACERC